jgi:hypothetical protein
MLLLDCLAVIGGMPRIGNLVEAHGRAHLRLEIRQLSGYDPVIDARLHVGILGERRQTRMCVFQRAVS